MELTNPINNQDMVDGLKRIVMVSDKLLAHCEHLLAGNQQEGIRAIVMALHDTHAGHIALLKDSILFLGGAPEKSREPSLLDRTGIFLSLSSLRTGELELIEACEEEIQRLVGSDEVIEKLNIVSDDVRQHVNALSHATSANDR